MSLNTVLLALLFCVLAKWFLQFNNKYQSRKGSANIETQVKIVYVTMTIQCVIHVIYSASWN